MGLGLVVWQGDLAKKIIKVRSGDGLTEKLQQLFGILQHYTGIAEQVDEQIRSSISISNSCELRSIWNFYLYSTMSETGALRLILRHVLESWCLGLEDRDYEKAGPI